MWAPTEHDHSWRWHLSWLAGLLKVTVLTIAGALSFGLLVHFLIGLAEIDPMHPFWPVSVAVGVVIGASLVLIYIAFD